MTDRTLESPGVRHHVLEHRGVTGMHAHVEHAMPGSTGGADLDAVASRLEVVNEVPPRGVRTRRARDRRMQGLLGEAGPGCERS